MKFKETQYDICRDHAERLLRTVAQLNALLEIYKNRDHNDQFLDSPFMLEMNEELFELNIRAEYLIQRLDPGYQGRLHGVDQPYPPEQAFVDDSLQRSLIDLLIVPDATGN